MLQLIQHRVAALFCGMLLFAAGCAIWQEDKDSIMVGVVLPLSGDRAESGNRVLDGVVTAAAELSQQEYFQEHPLQLTFFDNQGSPRKAEDAVRKAVAADAVAIIGPYGSDVALAVKRPATEANIAILTPTASDDDVSRKNDSIYQVCVDNTALAKAVAAHLAKSSAEPPTVAILLDLDEDGRYSRMLGRLFAQEYKKLGGKVISTTGIHSDKDFRLPMVKVIEAAPDAIFAPVFHEDALQVAGMAAMLDYSGILVGSEDWDTEQLAESVGKMDLKCKVVFPALSPETLPEDFVSAIVSRSGNQPQDNEALGYDAMMALADVFHELPELPTRESVKAAMKNKRTVTGSIGPFTINSQGGASRPVYIKTIEKQDGVPERHVIDIYANEGENSSADPTPESVTP